MFIGIFVLVIGTSDWADCSSNASGACSIILFGVVAALGALLIIIGFALMLIANKPEAPVILYAPKPPTAQMNGPSSSTSSSSTSERICPWCGEGNARESSQCRVCERRYPPTS